MPEAEEEYPERPPYENYHVGSGFDTGLSRRCAILWYQVTDTAPVSESREDLENLFGDNYRN
jgi:hypothetical protein